MGEKPLTWQQVLIVLCCFGLLPAGIFAWAPDIPASARLPGQISFFAIVAVIVLLGYSHWRRVSKKDLEPDILSTLVPPQQIMQLGPIHLFLTARQVGPIVRIVALAQNTRDDVGQIKLQFKPERRRAMRLASSSGVLAAPVDALEVAMEGGGVWMAWTDVALMPVDKAYELRLWMTGSGAASGKDVRFARRTAVTKKTPGWITALGLLVGHIHSGGGTFLRVNASPFAAGAGADARTQPWSLEPLWTPIARTPIEAINEQIMNVMR